MKGKQVPESSSSVTDSLRAGNRVVAFGIAAVVVILLAAAVFLFANLPDAGAFNRSVEQLFVGSNDLTSGAEIKLETMAVLAEARLDDEVLTGAQIEAVISGRNEVDCDEAAGATRIKRLRDTLGNQLVAELLVKTVARRGYMLAVGKDVIKMI